MRTKRAKELNALPPEQQQNARLTTHKRPTGKLERITAKLGLRGILNYLFHQK